MKKILFYLLIIIVFTACSSSGEEDKNIVAEDPNYAQYSISSDMLGTGRDIIEFNSDSKLALVEDTSGNNSVFYRFDLENNTLEELCEIPFTVIASGDDLFIDGRYYYFTNYSTNNIRVIYRLDIENGSLESINEHHLDSKNKRSDYNGPQKSDQWVKKDREHGKIKESKKRRKKPWDEHSTVRSSRRNWC